LALSDRPADKYALSPEAELVGLLRYNGIQYVVRKGRYCFLFAQGQKQWETICQCARHMVLVYGQYPFQADPQRAARALTEINAILVRGAMFLQGAAVVMRTGADLFDAYSAYETIARTLEYNANAVAAFWDRIYALRPDGPMANFS
jgi:hypothetical protein